MYLLRCLPGYDGFQQDLFFFIILILRGYKFPSKEDLLHLSIMGIALIGVGNGLLVFAEKYIPSGIAALIVTTIPFWMVSFDYFFLKGKKVIG